MVWAVAGQNAARFGKIWEEFLNIPAATLIKNIIKVSILLRC